MSSSNQDDKGEGLFFTIFSLAVIGLIYYFLWHAGIVRDWLSAGIAAAVVVVYVLICAVVFPLVNRAGSGPSGSSYLDAQKMEKQGRLYFLLLPGYFISQTVLRLFGRGQFGGGRDSK